MYYARENRQTKIHNTNIVVQSMMPVVLKIILYNAVLLLRQQSAKGIITMHWEIPPQNECDL